MLQSDITIPLYGTMDLSIVLISGKLRYLADESKYISPPGDLMRIQVGGVQGMQGIAES